MLPLSIPWLDSGNLKLSYINETPEAQVKLQDCYALKEHPSVCEGRLPVLLNLCTPDGKRLASTPDWPHFLAREWPHFLAREWPRLRPTVAKKFPGHVWR